MDIKTKDNVLKNRIIVAVLSAFVLVVGMLTAPVNQFASGALIIIGAISVYFFAVNKISEKNYLSFVPLFTVVWISTIGLAKLKLLQYQKDWEIRTWICLILATLCFQFGIPLGHKVGQKILEFIESKKDIEIGRLQFEFKKNRVFWICFCITLIAVALFVWNIFIKGYVPFFSTRFNAYIRFYTKRMIFVTAACAVSPIAYWCIKKCELSLWKKICMYFCIAINTFIIPILQVNRGVFIVASLMLTASVFFLNGKRFWVMLLCLVVTFGFYEVGSMARNYSNEYLLSVFEPTEFDPSFGKDDPDDSDIGADSGMDEDQLSNSVTSNFRLPAKVSFLYGYFTVSHDNFNEAVANASEYTYGVRQLAPFNVILRSEKISKYIKNAENHFVKPNLNTANLISSAYYDFREFGIAFLVIIWATILGAIEITYLKKKGVFALAALGNCLTPVVLCFFAPWFENFTMWMLWGTILLIMLFSSVSILPKNKKS